VPPGSTAQLATGPTAPFSPDQHLSAVTGFTRGTAKIWSNAKSIHCGAILAGRIGPGTCSMADLRVIAQGKKQRGD
jgi:hypothetical protein